MLTGIIKQIPIVHRHASVHDFSPGVNVCARFVLWPLDMQCWHRLRLFGVETDQMGSTGSPTSFIVILKLDLRQYLIYVYPWLKF